MAEITITEDGSHTIYVPELDEHYHSVHGAIQESMHIFIRNGFENFEKDRINILEIGFGTGLNAYLTALSNKALCKNVHYTSIEKFPLPDGITERLNYNSLIPGADPALFRLLHSSSWNTDIRIDTNFVIHKIKADLTEYFPEGIFDLVYFDAFGPDKQPEMWKSEIFAKIAEHTSGDAVLMTYSAKGDVKRKLRSNGFKVKLLPGPPGKRHIIKALKY